MLLVHVCVYFARVCFCPFFLPLDVEFGCDLWLRHTLGLSINVFSKILPYVLKTIC